MNAKAISQAKITTIAEVKLIPLDLIDRRDNIRTDISPESVAELARDIEARGHRTPVEVSPLADGRYVLTTGHRRYMAMLHLNRQSIAAIVVKIEDKHRLQDQLAENIQREDLSIKDQVRGIAAIFEEHGRSLHKTCQIVNKSKAWVSKRLSTAFNLNYQVESLMAAGLIEDIEIIRIADQLAASYPGHWCMFQKAVTENAMNRAKARDILAAAKAEKTPKTHVLGKSQADEEYEERKKSKAKQPQDQKTQTNELAMLLNALEAIEAELSACKQRSDKKCWIVSNASMAQIKEVFQGLPK